MDQRETTRRLRKYEAAEQVLFSAPETPRMDFLSPFGPLIARTRLPSELIDHLNQSADAILSSGVGGEFQVSEHDTEFGGDDSLKSCITAAIQRYVHAVEFEAPPVVEFDVFWVVSQYAGTPSPVHFHSGDLSGVLYLKVPQTDPTEEHNNYISGRQAGYLNFLIGGKQRFSRSLISFKPIVGDLYLFPGWLLHGAEPFRGTGERRSLAFNARVPRGGES